MHLPQGHPQSYDRALVGEWDLEVRSQGAGRGGRRALWQEGSLTLSCWFCKWKQKVLCIPHGSPSEAVTWKASVLDEFILTGQREVAAQESSGLVRKAGRGRGRSPAPSVEEVA